MANDPVSAASRDVVERYLAGERGLLAKGVEVWSIGFSDDGDDGDGGEGDGGGDYSDWGPQSFGDWRRTAPRMAQRASTEYSITPTAWTVDGERVAVEARGRMELTDGRVYDNYYHLLYVVQDGKITQAHHYYDTAHFYAIFGSDPDAGRNGRR